MNANALRIKGFKINYEYYIESKKYDGYNYIPTKALSSTEIADLLKFDTTQRYIVKYKSTNIKESMILIKEVE